MVLRSVLRSVHVCMYDIHASSENVFESLQMLRILLILKQQAIFNTPNRGTEEAEAAIQIAVQGGRRLQLPRKKKYSIGT